MPHRRHRDPHIKSKLVGAALLEKVSLQEHAGSLAELNDRAFYAFLAEGKMGGRIERDVLKRLDMSDLVRALRHGVLAGNDVAAEIDGDGIFSVHPALLP